MTAGTRAHRDDAVDALLRRLLGVAPVDDVVEYDTAVTVHGAHHFGGRPQARDDDRHAVLHAKSDVVLQPLVARVHDLIHRERRNLRGGIRALAGSPGSR